LEKLANTCDVKLMTYLLVGDGVFSQRIGGSNIELSLFTDTETLEPVLTLMTQRTEREREKILFLF